jgi:UDP-GlcNAc:undecaprenyl-phosphate GlcNAc-1-phosphate transferase
MFMQNDLMAIGSVMLVICILVATQIFGHVEFMMLANRVKSVGMSFIKPSNGSGAWHSSVRLQGTREWDMLWQSLIEYAEKSHLVEVRIDLNLASIQEAYHASWKRRSACERREQWRTEVPLFVNEHVVGRITICGERADGATVCEAVGRVMDMLETVEVEIASLATSQKIPHLAETAPSEDMAAVGGDALAIHSTEATPSRTAP